MAITDTIKQLIGYDAGGVSVTEYRCNDCGHTFDSAKSPDRCQCNECLSNDVEPTS